MGLCCGRILAQLLQNMSNLEWLVAWWPMGQAKVDLKIISYRRHDAILDAVTTSVTHTAGEARKCG